MFRFNTTAELFSGSLFREYSYRDFEDRIQREKNAEFILFSGEFSLISIIAKNECRYIILGGDVFSRKPSYISNNQAMTQSRIIGILINKPYEFF